MKSHSLPSTLHETLSIAIDDARALDRDTYLPHGRFWHGYSTEHPDRCLVCLAGSIISRTFEAEPTDVTSPGNFSDQTERKLRAVNHCRVGDYSFAFAMFHNVTAPSETQRLYDILPPPDLRDFIGWKQFETHLKSLEKLLPSLRKIEDAALSELR